MNLNHLPKEMQKTITSCYDTNVEQMDWEMLFEAIIDECLFAMLISSKGKFDMGASKEIVMQHFGLETDKI